VIGGHGRGDDDTSRASLAKCPDRREVREAGSEPVVHDDHGPAVHVHRRPAVAVALDPAVELPHLALHDRVDLSMRQP
jgi:hypothetical protein